MKISNRYLYSCIAILMASSFFADHSIVFAHNTNLDILAINGQVSGLTYGQWSAKWWQRAFQLADNFANCTEKQPAGPVWFLDGTTKGKAIRSCSIPQGKNIMFPLFNVEQSVVEAKSTNTGNLPGSS